jgi:hypothetical protein
MDKNLNLVAKELFGKIRTQFPKVQLGDANSKVTDRPEDARFFEFDFIKNGKNLGTISISIDDNDSEESDGLVVIYSNDIVAGQLDVIKKQWYRFLESLSDFASEHMMDFSIRDITKSNLEKRDYEHLSQNHGEGAMTESKLWGTSKTSFQEMGEAKLIVRHSKPVNYDLPAGRTMHIESIFIENAEGERFRYPYKHLNGARALATHVAHGGNSYDNIGQHIIGLSEELNKLRMFKGYVSRNPIVSEAMGTINEKVFERIDQVKKEIHSLQSTNYYKAFAESFADAEEQMIPEDVVNDWIDRLTIRSFNEELKNVFPYIYKLVGEEVDVVKELTVEDLLGVTEGMDSDRKQQLHALISQYKDATDPEAYYGLDDEYPDADEVISQIRQEFGDKIADTIEQGPSSHFSRDYHTHGYDPLQHSSSPRQTKSGMANRQDISTLKNKLKQRVGGHHEPSLPEETAFESFMNRLVSEDSDLFNTDEEGQSAAIQKLNQLIAQEFSAGVDGTNAIQSLKGVIDDQEFTDAIKQLGKVNPEMDIREFLKSYLEKHDEENGTDIASKINFDSTTPAPTEPAPEAPPAEPAAAAPVEQPAPVAEEKEDPPFDGPYTKKGENDKDQYGNTVKHKARHLAKKGMADAIAKAKKAGATSETVVNFGFGEMSLGEAITKAGLDINEFFTESSGKQEEIVEFVKSMYDENSGNFPKGETGVMIAVEKQFGEDATELAKHVIGELSQVYESKRMRQLAGITENGLQKPQADVSEMFKRFNAMFR